MLEKVGEMEARKEGRKVEGMESRMEARMVIETVASMDVLMERARGAA